MRGKPRLIQRSDSPYWFIYVPPTGGKRASRLSTGESDYSTAERIFAQWLLERKKPELSPLEEIRVIDMLVRYADFKSQDATVGYHMKHLQPFFKDMALSHICNQTVREYTAHRQKQKAIRGKVKSARNVSLSTIRRELDTLSATLGYARREGYIKEVPYIEKPAPAQPRERWLTYEEFGNLLAAASSNETLSAFINLAINTSARPSSIYQLKWFQVDMETKVIHFNPEGRQQTRKHRPSVSINSSLYTCLAKLRKKALSEYVLGGVGTLKKSFKNACDAAGLEGVTPYTLRHTAQTWIVRDGHGLAHAGQLAGHKDPRTTMRYVKHDPSFTKGATDSLSTGVKLAQKMSKNGKKTQKRSNKKAK